MAEFVGGEGAGAGRENLEGFEELDEAVALLGRQRIEGLPLAKGFAVVGFDGFACGGEFAVMHEGAALVVEAPEFASNEFAIPFKKPRRSCRLILIEGLAFGIRLGVACRADVVQLKVGVSGDHDDALRIRL